MEKLSNNALNQLEEVIAEMDFLNRDIYIKDKKTNRSWDFSN